MGSILSAIADDHDSWDHLRKALREGSISRENALRMWKSYHYVAGKAEAMAVLQMIDPLLPEEHARSEAANSRRIRVENAFFELKKLPTDELDEVLSRIAIERKEFWNG